MNIKLVRFYLYVVSMVFVISCVTVPKEKNIVKPNQPASVHKKIIIKAIENKNLELADKQYLELRGEHDESKLIAELILKLSEAHIETEEYLLSRYYSDAYINDYYTSPKVHYAEYLKVKGTFLRFKSSSTGGKLVAQMKEESKNFLNNYSRSKYKSKVKDMLVEFHKIRKERNEEIALAYERLDKPKAAKYYRDKNKD